MIEHVHGFTSWRPGALALCLALLGALAGAPVTIARPSPEPFEIVPGSFHMAGSTSQAGAHEDLMTEFDFAHNASGHTHNDVRTVVVNLPAGFDFSNTAVPTCTLAQLLAIGASEFSAGSGPADNQCPAESQVGTITFDITAGEAPTQRDTFPLYNMQVTSYGVTAELGFKSVYVTGTLAVNVRPGDSGLTVTSANIEQSGEPHAISVTTWGVPAAHVHDPERGMECFDKGGGGRVNAKGGAECFDGGQSVDIPAKPFSSNPTRCGVFEASMSAISWEDPLAAPAIASATTPEIVECERVPFDPSLEVRPTTDRAESSSGLDVTLGVAQTWEEPFSIATANVRDVTVALPVGYTVNPSEGNGLQGCTPEQYAQETALSGPRCPAESKLGTVVIETPLLSERIEGSVYLATPYDNVPAFGDPLHPNGSLLALYVVAKDPARGIIVKSAGKVQPDLVTGQLVSTFENLPQQPFSAVTFKLTQGEPSPLVSPPACGRYVGEAQLTPYSAEDHPREVSNELQIEHGIGGGPCPAGGVPPLSPTVQAGTQSNTGASYSPFYLRIARNDGEQELTRFSTIMPPGLTGDLSGIPFCPDSAIEAARGRTGQQELTEPSCPAASKTGHTLVGAGVGSVLAWTPGSVYLAGPYHGAPFSIVSVTSATVGPFDLGTVVIRFALRINPLTAQAEIDATESDPIPHIIKGIVVHVRDIHVYIDRPGFIINPTSCQRMSIANAIDGAGTDPANPADQQTVQVTAPFQTADCANLAFKPSFKVSTTGKTSKTNGANLNVKLAYPNAPQGTQANIHSVKVELPLQLPSRLTTLQKACTEQVFDANPASCPSASIVGHAVATTPILPVPVSGPAYFVSHGGAKFPELIVVLQGYGVTVDLHGETFISKKGITSSTFNQVPDVPVKIFELTLPQGPFSALTASSNLCSLTRTITQRKKTAVRVHGHRRTRTRKIRKTVPATLQMPTSFVAQNGATFKQSTRIAVTGCAKARKKKRSGRARKARRAARRRAAHR